MGPWFYWALGWGLLLQNKLKGDVIFHSSSSAFLSVSLLLLSTQMFWKFHKMIHKDGLFLYPLKTSRTVSEQSLNGKNTNLQIMYIKFMVTEGLIRQKWNISHVREVYICKPGQNWGFNWK